MKSVKISPKASENEASEKFLILIMVLKPMLYVQNEASEPFSKYFWRRYA